MSVSREPSVHVPTVAENNGGGGSRWSGSSESGAPAGASPGSPAASLHHWRSKNPLSSFRHAVEGVVHTFRTQRNMRFHFFTVALVLISGILYRLPSTEMLVLLFTASLVLITEMFNTAVEAVVDMITLSYHPAAKFAKDIAAGAVLIAAVNAVVVGFVLFLGGGRPEMLRYRLQQPPTLYLFVVAAVLLFIALLVWKILGEKGTLLQGGVVSGHSAIAFFLATTIIFVANNAFAAVLAFLLALLVAQSRVEARIHTLREVVIGAVLALFLTASVYRIPSWTVRYLPGGKAFVQPLLNSTPDAVYPIEGNNASD
ncbi:MAG: diacylglycerol kinase [Armatimonadota bacterium]